MKLFFITFLLVGLIVGCGVNIYEPLVSGSSDTGKLQQAANLIDDKNYAEALTIINSVEKDTNEKRLLQVAALLGNSGFDMWEIVVNMIDSGNTGTISFDEVFDSISGTVFGTGEDRQTRIDSITQSIQLLLNPPEGETRGTNNLNCFLGGVLSVVSVENSNQAITDVSAALQVVQTNFTGDGSTSDQCPGVDDLGTSLTTLSAAQTELALVLQATDGCSFIDFSGGSLNSAEERLSTFVTQGDQGCSATPSCGASLECQALSLGCVQEEVYDSTSVAGDGVVSSCEITQNCISGGCF